MNFITPESIVPAIIFGVTLIMGLCVSVAILKNDLKHAKKKIDDLDENLKQTKYSFKRYLMQEMNKLSKDMEKLLERSSKSMNDRLSSIEKNTDKLSNIQFNFSKELNGVKIDTAITKDKVKKLKIA